MVESANKKPGKRKGGAVLPPSTRIVDHPDWDPNAPDVVLAESPRGRKGGKGAKGEKDAPSGQPVERKTGLTATVLFGGLLLVVGGFGAWKLVDARNREAAAKTERAEAEAQAEAEAEAKAKANQPPPMPTDEELQALYLERASATATALEVDAPSLDELLAPNTFEHLVTHGKPVVIAPGGRKTIGALSFKVRVETLNLERRGIRSKGQHTMLVVENTTDQPLAYRLSVRKATVGECRSPVMFHYDAMVIDPGETAEVSVCSGRQSAEIIDLRTLAVSKVGARWIRQLPAKAVGNDDMAVTSHEVSEDIEMCDMGSDETSRAIKENLVKWEDVIDFYSRHDCRHYPWAPQHRLATAPIEKLPIQPKYAPPDE